MSITNPTQLVDEFKKSGEFDRLRRELLSQFQQSDGISTFKTRIEDIARQRITSDKKLRYLPTEAVYRELMQEMDRYPVVERAAADVKMLSDPVFSANIRKSVQRILHEGRGSRSQSQTQVRKDNESDVNQGEPGAIHSPKISHQGVFSRPLAEVSPALQSPNVTLNANTSPAIMLRENSPQVPESKKMELSGLSGQSESSPTILAELDLTTAGGVLVDVEMADELRPDELANTTTITDT